MAMDWTRHERNQVLRNIVANDPDYEIVMCAGCAGSGYDPDDPTDDCPVCKGVGEYAHKGPRK